jgi:hypothetical protein
MSDHQKTEGLPIDEAQDQPLPTETQPGSRERTANHAGSACGFLPLNVLPKKWLVVGQDSFTIESQLQQCEKLVKKSNILGDRSDDAAHQAISSVGCLIMRLVREKKDREFAIDLYKSRGLRVTSKFNPVVAIFMILFYEEPRDAKHKANMAKTAEKRAKAFMYAVHRNQGPDEIATFLKENGGIDNCANAFRAVQKTNNADFERKVGTGKNTMPTKEHTSKNMRSDVALKRKHNEIQNFKNKGKTVPCGQHGKLNLASSIDDDDYQCVQLRPWHRLYLKLRTRMRGPGKYTMMVEIADDNSILLTNPEPVEPKVVKSKRA